MKDKYLLILILLFVAACSPTVEEQTTLTSTAKIAIASAWTRTPTVTHTATSTVTPTSTSTKTITLTPSKTPRPTVSFTPTIEPWPTPTLMATRVTTDTATIVNGFNDFAVSLAWSLDGKYLYIGTKEKGLAAYDFVNKSLGPYVGNNLQIQALAISPNGKILAAGIANDGSIRLLSTETGALELTIWPAHNDWPQSFAFGPKNDWLVSSGDDGRLLLWDIKSGELLRTIYEDGSSLGISLSPDGRQLIAGFGYEGLIRVWDTQTWSLLRTFDGDQAQDLAISPDGKRIVTAGGGIHEANVWDVSTGELVFNLREHPSWVWAVAYSPKGNIIASAGLGESVILWDAKTGEAIRELYGGSDFIQTLAFSPDGNWLASGGSKVILWDVSEY